jgi:hypothetical protein
MDVLASFLDEHTIRHPDLSIQTSELYVAIQDWYEVNGERIWRQKVFGMRLGENGGLPG